MLVQILGNIFWPDGSINHELEFGYYEGNETVFSTYTISDNVDSFPVNFTEIIRDNGYVAAITGTCQVIASFTFPGNYSRYRITFYQDYLAERSAYFTNELTGEQGEFVNDWRRWVLVQRYDLIQTNLGNRPAINLGDNLTNWIFEPSLTWIGQDYYSYWYDLETGYLLLSDCRMSMTSVNITVYKFYRGVLISTNMYVPRIEQIFPWIGIGVLLVGIIVIGILSLWLEKRLRSP